MTHIQDKHFLTVPIILPLTIRIACNETNVHINLSRTSTSVRLRIARYYACASLWSCGASNIFPLSRQVDPFSLYTQSRTCPQGLLKSSGPETSPDVVLHARYHVLQGAAQRPRLAGVPAPLPGVPGRQDTRRCGQGGVRLGHFTHGQVYTNIECSFMHELREGAKKLTHDRDFLFQSLREHVPVCNGSDSAKPSNASQTSSTSTCSNYIRPCGQLALHARFWTLQ